MKLAQAAIVFLLFIITTGCISRNGAVYDGAQSSEISSVEGEGQPQKGTYIKADTSKYRYVDQNVNGVVDIKDYHRMRTHNFVDYYSKKLSKEQRREIRMHLKDKNSENQNISLDKTKDGIEFFIYKQVQK